MCATLIGVDNDQAMVNRSREKGFDARLCRVQELSVAVTEAVDELCRPYLNISYGSEALDFVTYASRNSIRWNSCFCDTKLERVLCADEGFWLDQSHIRPYPPAAG